MQITLNGVLSEDCEKKTDKKGREYIRFRVGCKDIDNSPNPSITVFRCFSYNTQFSNLKKGDYVFITGSLKTNTFNEKTNLDVYISNIVKGYLKM